jgi:hypothetical protein
MNVYQILNIYLIPEKNNGQQVCFKGNLKRLVHYLLDINVQKDHFFTCSFISVGFYVAHSEQ